MNVVSLPDVLVPLTTVSTKLVSGLCELRIYDLGPEECIGTESHPLCHFLIPLAGKVRVRQNDSMTELDGGDVAQVSRDEPYGLESPKGCRLLIVMLKEES